MIVKPKPPREPIIEAFKVCDEQFLPLVRRLGGHVQVHVDFGGITIDDPRMSPASEGDYVVFVGDEIVVYDEIGFRKNYEEVPEDYRFHSKRLPEPSGWQSGF